MKPGFKMPRRWTDFSWQHQLKARISFILAWNYPILDFLVHSPWCPNQLPFYLSSFRLSSIDSEVHDSASLVAWLLKEVTTSLERILWKCSLSSLRSKAYYLSPEFNRILCSFLSIVLLWFWITLFSFLPKHFSIVSTQHWYFRYLLLFFWVFQSFPFAHHWLNTINNT